MITVVGSINMDIAAYIDSYPLSGETKFGKKMKISSGGKGANQAVACAKLGKEVNLIGCIGIDLFGDMVYQSLNNNHINTRFIKRTKEYATGSVLISVDDKAENTMIVLKGANDALNVKDIDNCLEEIKNSKVLLVQMEIPEDVAIYAMRKAREYGVFIILDPAPADGVTLRSLKYVDLIVPNLQETKQLTGIEVTDEKSAYAAAKYFESIGITKSIIKMAEKGSFVYCDKKWIPVEAISVKAVDTVGAGDCFAGAIASALDGGQNLIDAVRYATIVSALKVTKVGAQSGIPTIDDVNEFCKKKNLI